MLFDRRDYILGVSLYVAGKIMSKSITMSDIATLRKMINACNLDESFGQIKYPTYFWSNSDGITKWIYDKILRRIKKDPHKGANGDQLRAFYLLLYLTSKIPEMKPVAKQMAWRHVCGFVCRLGMFPSLLENVIFKPQVVIMLLRTIWKPLSYPLYPFINLAWWREKRIPISKDTTNKITLLPTMCVLGMEMPTSQYIKEVYKEYFKPGTDGEEIGRVIARGIVYYDEA